MLSLDIWDEEGGDKILDEHLWLVLLGLNLIDELVESLSLELGLLEGLEGRCFVDGLSEDVLEV